MQSRPAQMPPPTMPKVYHPAGMLSSAGIVTNAVRAGHIARCVRRQGRFVRLPRYAARRLDGGGPCSGTDAGFARRSGGSSAASRKDARGTAGKPPRAGMPGRETPRPVTQTGSACSRPTCSFRSSPADCRGRLRRSPDRESRSTADCGRADPAPPVSGPRGWTPPPRSG